jgi:hypothetical protein
MDSPLQTLQAFSSVGKFFTHAHFTVVKVLAQILCWLIVLLFL